MAALRLNPNFAAGIDQLARPLMEQFDDFDAFQKAPLFAGLSLAEFRALPSRDSQITLKKLAFSVKNMGSGTVDGTIVLDNQKVSTQFAPQQFGPPQPSIASRLRRDRETRSRATRDQATATISGAADQAALRPRARPLSTNRIAQTPDESEAAQPQSFDNLPPVRLAGTIVVSQARLTGAPGGGGSGTLLDLPDVPALDLHVVLGENTRLDTPVMRADIGGEIEVLGTPRTPLATGTLFIRSGQISFPKARARLTEGEISFSASRDPILNTLVTRLEVDITARGRVEKYDITLELKGPVELGPVQQETQNLKINVTSNPPLSQGEALEKLLGTAALNSNDGDDSLLTGSASDRYKSAVVSLLSAPLFAGIERSLEDALGLSSVSLEYSFNEPLGVEVGKAIGNRAYVTYRRTIGNSGSGPTPYDLRIEYRIRGNLNIGVETDERERRKITVEKTWRF